MRPRPIGYYVHHHGDGHRQRALAIAAHAGGRIVLLGTGLSGRTGDVRAVDLPDDRLAGGGFDGCDGVARPASLHYAPIDHDGVRRRVAAIAGWIADERPALIVADVSVEVAMLARLASVPTVMVRLAGRRDDLPHLEAFRGARALLAPFPAALDDDRSDPAIRACTTFFPGLTARPPEVTPEPDLVVAVIGRGGSRMDGEAWAAAARATPDRRWRILGPCAVPAAPPPNLAFAGWVDDPAGHIARAGIVVGGAGDGVVGAVIAARRPFVCLPEDRPFDEQRSKARRLAAIGAAVVRDDRPTGGEWPQLLDAAAAIPTDRLAALDDPDGPARAAAWLEQVADGRTDMDREAL